MNFCTLFSQYYLDKVVNLGLGRCWALEWSVIFAPLAMAASWWQRPIKPIHFISSFSLHPSSRMSASSFRD